MKELKKDRTEERKERSKKGRQKERKKCREFVNGCITKQINEPRCLCDEIARERTTASVEYALTDGCALYKITTRWSLPGLTVNASHKSFILLKCICILFNSLFPWTVLPRRRPSQRRGFPSSRHFRDSVYDGLESRDVDV